MATLTDDAIERQVEQAIGLDPRVGVFDVNIQVLRGVARLEGIVESLEAKRAAGEAAARVPGVRRVDNMLTVEDPRGLKSLDIEHAVENALENAPAVDPRDVGARVEDSVAHLVGHVDSTAEEDAAVRVASRAEGVKEIVSELDISPGRDIDWTDLKNQVVDALSTADDLIPYTIDVEVETDGRVVLSGSVATRQDCRRAVEIARQVPGAKEVVNRLQVGG